MKGLFIPEITVEMFRNGCLESIETLMAEGEVYDIEYDPKSEEPGRKKGKWIGKEQYANSPEYYSWQCSMCNCVLEDPTLDKPYPFCPICGSYNGGEEE